MSTTLESLTDLLSRGQLMPKLGMSLGASEADTRSATEAVGPAVIGGLADKANTPGGEAVVSQLLDDNDGSILADLGGYFAGGGSPSGASLVQSIFGSSYSGVVSAISQSAGLDVGIIGKAITALTPVIVGLLAKRRADEGLSSGAIVSLLNQEKTQRGSSGLGSNIPGMAAGASAVGGAATAAGNLTGKAEDVTRSATAKTAGAFGAAGATVGTTASSVGSAATGKSTGGFMKWLWPVLLLLAALIALAWLLTQCDFNDSEATGTDADTTIDADEDNDTTGAEDSDATADEDDSYQDSAASDIELAPAVQAAVASVDGADDVTADVDSDGSVTLTGAAETEETKQAAADAVMGVDGVTDVVNNITISDADSDQEPATVNEELDLEPITFEVNSAVITAEGTAVLDQAVAYFEENEDVNFEIGGHTDSDGDEAANLVLSENRAVAVRDYLAENGIAEDRMTTKGFGETVPKVDNDTPENKAINRRIEFTVTS